MNDLLSLAITGLLLGLAYSAVPGAVNTEALRRGLDRGFRPAALVQTGALLGDIGWAVLGLTGAVVLIQRDAIATTFRPYFEARDWITIQNETP